MKECAKLRRSWRENPIQWRNDHGKIKLTLFDNSIGEVTRWTFRINDITWFYQVIVNYVFGSERTTKMFNLIHQSLMDRHGIDLFLSCTQRTMFNEYLQEQISLPALFKATDSLSSCEEVLFQCIEILSFGCNQPLGLFDGLVPGGEDGDDLILFMSRRNRDQKTYKFLPREMRYTCFTH